MDEHPSFKPFVIPSLALTLLGLGGLISIIFVFNIPPYIWARWGFFILFIMTVTGMMLPVVYFFHRRFPDEKPAEANVIVRQALWFGIYGATLAWLQLGHLVTIYVVLGLAGGLIAIEYFTRLREKARWKPPVISDDQSS